MLAKSIGMFTDEEVAGFHGVFKRTDYIEIQCGCTVPRYGDTPGKLRIYVNGKLEIDCNCSENCSKGNLHPIEFAKHAGKTNSHNNWKNQVWVTHSDGTRVSLKKTPLLKYHTETYQRPRRQISHRDEFLSCSSCQKKRRFYLRNKEDCMIYHDALTKENWQCSDMPNLQLTCNDEEERECRLVRRGCPRTAKCKGCIKCVCLGCNMCRFEDCTCQQCVEFIQNM